MMEMDTSLLETYCDSCGGFHIVHCENCAELHCANVRTQHQEIIKLCVVCSNHHSEKCTFCSPSHWLCNCCIILADLHDSPPPTVVHAPAPVRKHPRLDYKSATCNIWRQVISYKGSLDLHYPQQNESTTDEPHFFTQGQGVGNRLQLSHTVLNTIRVYKLNTTNYKYTDIGLLEKNL